MAVSFDEAWGQTLGFEPQSKPSSDMQQAEQFALEQEIQKRPKMKEFKSARHAMSESKKRKKNEDEELLSAKKKCKEEEESAEEKLIRKAVVYVSIIIVIVLLCVNLVTLNRLHYTTETLLLYMKHKP